MRFLRTSFKNVSIRPLLCRRRKTIEKAERTVNRMVDKCEVLSQLNECVFNGNCMKCGASGDRMVICESLVTNALELLKEKDAVKPKYNARTNWYECGACHYSMTSGMHCRSELIPATKVRYCANCGFPVNWEGR